jgi:hypothetical protein
MGFFVTDWLHSLTKHTAPKQQTNVGVGTARLTPAQAANYPNQSNNFNGLADYSLASSPQVQGAYTYGSGGSGGGGVGGGGAIDPSAAQKQSLIGDLQGKWNTLQSVYNSLFGKIDDYAHDAVNRLQQGYDTQQNQDINNFNKTQSLTGSMYAARGIGDSSYLGDAQNQNANDFNNALSQQALSRDDQLAQIGQNVSGQKAQLQAQQNAYAPYIQNLSQYGVSDLQGLQGNLASAIGNANTTAAGIGTNSDFIGKLNAITPLESAASSQLAAKLKNLTLSSAPAQAKKYIAQGLIKASSLNDSNAQSYWTNYFDQLLNGQV